MGSTTAAIVNALGAAPDQRPTPAAIVFIDAGVTDATALHAALGSDVEVHVLDAGPDALAQMAAALAGRSGLASIHLFSHGAPGQLLLGSLAIDAASMPELTPLLATLGAALAADGDLLVYACELARGEGGRLFVDALAQATGADVAASVDRSGAAALGGNWALEWSAGSVETASLQPLDWAWTLETPDIGQTPATAGVMPLVGSVTGTIGSSGDLDWYGITLTVNVEVQISLGKLASGANPLYDSYLRLHDAAGAQLAYDDDGGGDRDSRLSFTPTTTGTYYLSAGGYSSNTGDYAMRVATLATGTSNADTLPGTPGNDVINAGSGNDVVGGGAGDDLLAGESGNDTLDGGSGDDTLDGGYGNDSMTGGSGNDRYVVDSLTDSVVETSSVTTEIDSVTASVSFTLPDNIEHLSLSSSNITGTGNALANRMTLDYYNGTLLGMAADDTLVGSYGDDSLDGGLGNDSMSGGDGNDRYVVDATGDIVVETNGDATQIDTIVVSVAYPLPANVEGLTLAGTLVSGVGNESANVITGNALNNSLSGLAGNDTLDGGAGNDTLDGGSGNDRYVVDAAGDRVIETSTAASEIDSVWAGVDFTLPVNVEHLTLTDTAAAGTGNDSANLLVGNAAANSLTGLAGDDTLDGGASNDTLAGGAGMDTARYSLAARTSGGSFDGAAWSGTAAFDIADGLGGTDRLESMERLWVQGSAYADTLAAGPGADLVQGEAGHDALSGRAGDDTLEGGSGNDTLDGGSGNDSMTGGDGSDRYVVGSATDAVVETSTDEADIDLVVASVDYTLPANVEQLTLAGTASTGTGNDHDSLLTGNDGANSLRGLAGDDTLAGGAGNDTLVGGEGSDTALMSFRVAAAGVAFDGAAWGSTTVFDIADGLGGTDHVDGVELLWLEGSAFADTLAGSPTGDRLQGSEGHDALAGRAGGDTLEGGSGNDTLDGGSGADSMAGGEGSDRYIVDDAGDVVIETAIGGSDVDTLVVSADVEMSLNVENLEVAAGAAASGVGNAQANRMTGSELGNRLEGREGIDTLLGHGGNDSLHGGDGADSLDGGAGEDELAGDAGDDTLAGGDGIDIAVYDFREAALGVVFDGSAAASAALVTLADGLGGSDRLESIERLWLGGSAESDSLLAGMGADLLFGDAGNDTLRGQQGTDIVYGDHGDDALDGGDGDDWLAGDAGNDSLVGGAGFDTAYYGFWGQTQGVAFDGAASGPSADATIGDGLGGGDRLQGIEQLWVDGSNFADTLTGGAGDDHFSGAAGSDSIAGGAGADTLSGGDDADTLDGGAGADWLAGDAGSDSLSGGSGNDTLAGGPGADTLAGGDGTDIAAFDFAAASAGVLFDASAVGGSASLDLADEQGFTDRLLSIEGVWIDGSAFDDTLIGGAGDDLLAGGAGDDRLDASAGNDTLVFAGRRSAYTVSFQASTSSYVLASPTQGSDTVGGGETFVFDNVTLTAAALIDNQAPTASAFRPADGETGVAIDADIVVTFSEAIEAGAAAMALKTGAGVVVESFTAGDAGVSITGNVLRIDPAASLGFLTTYRLEITSGALRDLAGNAYAGTASYDFVTMAQPNVAPVSSNGSASIGEDGVLDTLLPAASDANGDAVSYGKTSDPAHGTLTVQSNGSYRYTPAANYHGSDSFGFRVSDPSGAGNDYTVALTITPVNDAPTGSVAISGEARVGATLTASTSALADADGLGPLAYQWLRASAPIAGATAASYVATAADIGQVISLRVSWTDGGGTAEALSSAATAPVQPAVTVITGTAGNDTLLGTSGNDSISGLAGNDWIAGGAGSDLIDGGEGIDVASFRDITSPLTASWLSGTVGYGSELDAIVAVEALFGGSGADSIRGADGAATQRGETVRGGGGNDTIDGGTGVDTAEFTGAGSGYTVTRNGSQIVVTDTLGSDGAEGIDTLTGVERLIFADRLLAFGTRAEEIARVAFVLWSPGILVSTALFSRGYSYYDVGYGFAEMCGAALQFHGEQDLAFAQKLKANMPASSLTAEQILATMTAAGGGHAGRVAAVIQLSNDPATEAAIEASGIRVNGVAADLEVPGFGVLFGLLPG